MPNAHFAYVLGRRSWKPSVSTEKAKTQFNIYTQAYRSGHNEAVLKTVRAKAHGGSNPSACAKGKSTLSGAFSFGIGWDLRETHPRSGKGFGRLPQSVSETKTVNNRFCESVTETRRNEANLWFVRISTMLQEGLQSGKARRLRAQREPPSACGTLLEGAFARVRFAQLIPLQHLDLYRYSFFSLRLYFSYKVIYFQKSLFVVTEPQVSMSISDGNLRTFRLSSIVVFSQYFLKYLCL